MVSSRITKHPGVVAAGSFTGGVAAIYAVDKVKILGDGSTIIDGVGDIV